MGPEAASAGDVLALVALGAMLAVLGQLVRFVAELADPENMPFQLGHFLVSIGIAVAVGVAAGAVGAVTFVGASVGAGDVLALIGLGYVGTDMVEQFLKRAFPGLTGPAPFAWTVTEHEHDAGSHWEPSTRN